MNELPIDLGARIVAAARLAMILHIETGMPVDAARLAELAASASGFSSEDDVRFRSIDRDRQFTALEAA